MLPSSQSPSTSSLPQAPLPHLIITPVHRPSTPLLFPSIYLLRKILLSFNLTVYFTSAQRNNYKHTQSQCTLTNLKQIFSASNQSYYLLQEEHFTLSSLCPSHPSTVSSYHTAHCLSSFLLHGKNRSG